MKWNTKCDFTKKSIGGWLIFCRANALQFYEVDINMPMAGFRPQIPQYVASCGEHPLLVTNSKRITREEYETILLVNG